MNAAVALAVLRELGVLFQSREDAGGAAPANVPASTAPGAHALYPHVPLWDYEMPHIAQSSVPLVGLPLYETLPPELSPEQVLGHTRLIVFLGAENSEVFRRCLAEPKILLVVLEPDAERLARFAREVPAASLAKRAIILHGEPDDFDPPFCTLLPRKLFSFGFPAFYCLDSLRGERPDYVAETVELLELLFYRYRVYPVSGQANLRGLPLRPMVKKLFFDQQLHAYQNLQAMVQAPDISCLRKAFQGETAILIAAGPDLAEQTEYLLAQRENALLIAVNNALKPLLAAGVRPHFVVSNDTSLDTGRSWEGLPRLDDVSLVAYCLTDLGRGIFGRRYLFGNHRPEIFGARPGLRLHGSVITTAFSLARHMGCVRCVLIGAQLCSDDPWRMAYARGSIHSAPEEPSRPLTHAHPQLYPVRGMEPPAYASLNFLDAARWLLDEIRVTGVPCVNTTQRSLVRGPGVTFAPRFPVEPTGRLARRLGRLAALWNAPHPTAPVLEHLNQELGFWTTVADVCAKLLQVWGPGFVPAAMEALRQFDASNVSYLVQRFEDFDNAQFHKAVLETDPGFFRRHGISQEEARDGQLRFYLENVECMAGQFLDVLEEQRALLTRPQSQAASQAAR